VTRQLRDAARTVEIELVDHVILGRAEADPAGADGSASASPACCDRQHGE